MRHRLVLLLVVVLVGACANKRPEFPPRSPVPSRCMADCPHESPAEQQGSLRTEAPVNGFAIRSLDATHGRTT